MCTANWDSKIYSGDNALRLMLMLFWNLFFGIFPSNFFQFLPLMLIWNWLLELYFQKYIFQISGISQIPKTLRWNFWKNSNFPKFQKSINKHWPKQRSRLSTVVGRILVICNFCTTAMPWTSGSFHNLRDYLCFQSGRPVVVSSYIEY